MKRRPLILALLVLSSTLMAQPLDPERPPLGHGEMTGYPWVEPSEVVRVPKSLLRYFDFDALEFSTDPENPKWSVSDRFIGVYGLTAAQAEALTLELNRAREALRRAEAEHFKPIDGPLFRNRYRDLAGLTVLDERTYLLELPTEALEEIERNLRGGILRILGKQRSSAFWDRSRLGSIIHSSTMRSESFTFRLIEIGSTRSVDLVRTFGGGSSGGPYFETEDQYAPEVLKPVLKQWRASAREFQRTNSAAVVHQPLAPPTEEVAARTHSGGTEMTRAGAASALRRIDGTRGEVWNEEAAYADCPKSLIPRLGMRTMDSDEISPEAEVLFGLTSDEARTVNGLFKEFRARFELLESSHLVRPNAAHNRFVLNKFPEEAKTLCEEWLLRLKAVAGDGRGELLDLCMKETEAQFPRARFDHRRARRQTLVGWPVWLLRGTRSYELTANFEAGLNERFSLELRDLEDPDGLKASLGGPIRGFPLDLRHLFPIEGLDPTRKPDSTLF